MSDKTVSRYIYKNTFIHMIDSSFSIDLGNQALRRTMSEGACRSHQTDMPGGSYTILTENERPLRASSESAKVLLECMEGPHRISSEETNAPMLTPTRVSSVESTDLMSALNTPRSGSSGKSRVGSPSSDSTEKIDECTTVMLRNISSKYTPLRLREDVDACGWLPRQV